MPGANALDLGLALHRRVVLEVGGHHPQQAERRLHHRLEQHPRHVGHLGSHGQGSCTRVTWRTGRRLRIMLPKVRRLPSGCGGVDGDPGNRGEARQQRGDQRELVLAGTALQRREVAGHFLQAEDVEVGKRPGLVDDALRVDPAVDAEAPLDVPVEDLHGAKGYSGRNLRSAVAAIPTTRPRPGSERNGVVEDDAKLERGRRSRPDAAIRRAAWPPARRAACPWRRRSRHAGRSPCDRESPHGSAASMRSLPLA